MDTKTVLRFWSKVDKDGPVPQCDPELGPCWVWTAGSDRDSYGAFYADGRQHKAHRAGWSIQCGAIPAGDCVLHHCDNPPCVRGSHLFLGSHAKNVADKIMKGRQTSKVVEADVVAIRLRCASGVLQCKVAEDFGIHRTQVCRIVNRKNWAYVE